MPKNGFHAHTNGAKAAFNMITRTVGQKWLKEDGICVYSADTGWVTNEYPIDKNMTYRVHVPLDEIDGACRVLYPLFECQNKNLKPEDVTGKLFKDYKIRNW